MKNTPENRPLVFILASPCAGAALLGDVLAAHPQLFAPPALHLLSFKTLQERRSTLTRGHPHWRGGVRQAIMTLEQCPAEEAEAALAAFETQDLTTPQFYKQLQQRLGDKILVDQTTDYALEPDVLDRAERDYENPLYINLVRHPYGMIHSFEMSRFDRFYGPEVLNREALALSTREFAELIWLVSYRNILDHLETIPQHRRCRLTFEALVRRPRATIETVCQFLALDFYSEMATFQNTSTSPTPADSDRPALDPETADAWRTHYLTDFLGDMTWHVAELLGYKRGVA